MGKRKVEQRMEIRTADGCPSWVVGILNIVVRIDLSERIKFKSRLATSKGMSLGGFLGNT